MKADIHPDYNDVVFLDASVDPPLKILTRSTRTSEETIEWENGTTYPLIRVEISSASHPFYTGKQKLVDTAGMVERYRKRYGIGPSESSDEESVEATVEVESSETPASEDSSAADSAPEQETPAEVEAKDA